MRLGGREHRVGCAALQLPWLQEEAGADIRSSSSDSQHACSGWSPTQGDALGKAAICKKFTFHGAITERKGFYSFRARVKGRAGQELSLSFHR
jgi:hypothetical protein